MKRMRSGENELIRLLSYKTRNLKEPAMRLCLFKKPKPIETTGKIGAKGIVAQAYVDLGRTVKHKA